jgi:hypothetical protein
MTTINAVFEGKEDDLRTVLVFAIRHASIKRILGQRLYVSWICEEEDYQTALEDCMDCVRMDHLGPVQVLRMG